MTAIKEGPIMSETKSKSLPLFGRVWRILLVSSFSSFILYLICVSLTRQYFLTKHSRSSVDQTARSSTKWTGSTIAAQLDQQLAKLKSPQLSEEQNAWLILGAIGGSHLRSTNSAQNDTNGGLISSSSRQIDEENDERTSENDRLMEEELMSSLSEVDPAQVSSDETSNSDETDRVQSREETNDNRNNSTNKSFSSIAAKTGLRRNNLGERDGHLEGQGEEGKSRSFLKKNSSNSGQTKREHTTTTITQDQDGPQEVRSKRSPSGAPAQRSNGERKCLFVLYWTHFCTLCLCAIALPSSEPTW